MADMTMDNNIGKKLDGRYELLELIGVGGMADIYRAMDTQEDRVVAVKILKTEFAGSEEFLRRFRNESKAIALLSHPNIVKIYDVGFTDKVQFIVMEYVDGITLADYIEQQGVLKWRDAVHFTVQVLRALQHAHDRGIVHRDVKSSNIMLLRDGTIKVMDFGIARFNRENNKTMSEKTIGSVHYISPEQARGDITDERSDIYSVGVALYEMLTGKKPFDGDTPVAIALKHMQSVPKKPSEINETIPEGLEQIVLKAMQKEPSARYQTAGEMINELEEFKRNPGIVFDYKYNSTDGSAKYADRPVPAAEQEQVRRKRIIDEEDYEEYDDDDDDDELEERRSPLIPILFAVGAAFVICTVFLILILVQSKLGSGNSDSNSSMVGITIAVDSNNEFHMPNLIGMTWDEALQIASQEYNNKPIMTLVKQEEWNEATKGQIFDQETAESRKVKVGSSVVVKVSKGIREVEIPNVAGWTVDRAEQQLLREGFKVSKKYSEDEEVAKDRVISTTPAAHEMLPQGETVILKISTGANDKPVSVPKLTGMPLYEAQKRCEEYHLAWKVSYVNSEEEKDTVIGQSIAPNELAPRNSEIVLSVSSGEIPMMESTVNISVPNNLTGEFEFRFYVGSILDSSATEIRDISLSGSKELKYIVTGEPGETKTLSVKVKSTSNGNEGLFYEIRVEFPEEGDPQQTVEFRNSDVFTELLGGEIISSTTSNDESDPNETSLWDDEET